MKIHEYQAKALFKKFGITVPKSILATNEKEAASAIEQITTDIRVVKAQVHAGGRGKAGGVKVTKTPEDAMKAANSILGMTLVTHQTGPEGVKVNKIIVEEGLPIAKELYFAILVDRAVGGPVIIASTAGGMEIEEVAEHTPELILTNPVGAKDAFPFLGRKIANQLGLTGKVANEFTKLVMNAVKMFHETDCSLLEINPLIITSDERVVALDGKVDLEDNGLVKHPELLELQDNAETDPLEIEAAKYSLNYIKLDGTIGCMVNGAGLAMATMDVVTLAGGSPANFLDVGGGANREQVKNAMKILLSDKNVKGVFINIFGGIMRCDIIAHGVIDASKEMPSNIPIVMRLRGTNLEEGRALLQESGLKFHLIDDMSDAAKKIVAEVK